MDLSFLSSHSSANNSDHSGSLPSDLGFRSDAAAATSNLHTDTGFILPRVQDPAHFARTTVSGAYNAKDQMIKASKGTTCLGFVFQGGVCIAVDSRASQGPYVGSQTVKKVIEINPFLLGTMAGGAADCQFWERDLGIKCRLHELREGERISVAAASKLLCNTMYQYRGYGLSMGTMVAGWDKTGPQLYMVDNDANRLHAVKGGPGHGDGRPYFSVGSGSTYAYGVLDTNYRWDMTEEEAIMLGKRAIYHATYRDAYSGGMNQVYIVREDGWEKCFYGDVLNLHQLFSLGKDQHLTK